MIGFPIALLASNAAEWAVHKYVLHGLGRKRGTFWSFHFHEHHKTVRKTRGYDPQYEGPFFQSSAKSKEALGVFGMALVATPLLSVAPWFVAGTWVGSSAYYFVHRKAHLDPEWAKRHVPWHVDHHLGPDPNKNYCVTVPLFDHLMGTRKPWVGTPECDLDAKATAPEPHVQRAQPRGDVVGPATQQA